MARIMIPGYECERCSHKWVGMMDRDPMICPRCKSPYWDRPRRLAITQIKR